MGRVAVAAWLLLACLLPGSSTVQPPGRAIPRILHQTNTLPSVCPRAELVEVLPAWGASGLGTATVPVRSLHVCTAELSHQ